MEYLVTSAEMKRCDGNTIEHFGMPSMVLIGKGGAGLCGRTDCTG